MVEDDDQFMWGIRVDMLTNGSICEYPGEPFCEYYNPKKYSRRRPLSERSLLSLQLARIFKMRVLTISGKKKLISVARNRERLAANFIVF